MQKFLMTQDGFSKLNIDLKRLINEERPLIIERLKDARGYGGELSENTEYMEAKDAQDCLERKIVEIQKKLDNAKVVSLLDLVNDGVARFGTIVSLNDLDTDLDVEYQIVGIDESSIKDSKISYLSPIGAAMLNKRIGDVIYFRTPSGERELEITKVTLPNTKKPV